MYVLHTVGNEPYDPDMTVHEALAAGLIAIIDTGVIATGNYEPCGYEGPFKPQNSAVQNPSSIRCNRSKGHHGMHAHVTRWDISQRDHEDFLRAQKRQRAAAERFRREREEAMRQQQESLRKAAAEVSERLGVMGTDIEKALNPTAQAMVKLDLDLKRATAKVHYSIERHKKNDRFRDKNAGKVRGK